MTEELIKLIKPVKDLKFETDPIYIASEIIKCLMKEIEIQAGNGKKNIYEECRWPSKIKALIREAFMLQGYKCKYDERCIIVEW